MTTPAPKTILVTGDLVVDHHIYEGARYHYGDRSPGVNVKRQAGGAGLIADLLKSLPDLNQVVFASRKLPDEGHDGDICDHAYAFWQRLPADGVPEKQFWQCNKAMGFGNRELDKGTPPEPPCKKWEQCVEIPSKPEIVVISEGGMGFRDTPECWKNLGLDTASIIILKTAWPLAEGDLWPALTIAHSHKLMVVVSATELRKSDARLSYGLSWEATFQTLLHEISQNGRLSALTKCRHLVVTFGSEGAAWFDFGSGKSDRAGAFESGSICFIYHAACIEHDHARGTAGTAFGFLTCLAASLARQAAWSDNPTDTDFAPAIEAGLAAMRDLRIKGHGVGTEKPSGFPFGRLAAVICDPDTCYTRSRLPWPKAAKLLEGSNASILSLTAKPAEALASTGGGAAWEFARLICLHGPIALGNLPHLCVGKLLTGDRHEVESLRLLSQVVDRYHRQDEGKRPLSIGVFGPPGSGKSYAVREIALAFLGKKADCLEFNLSQFASPEELNGAFHRVRDAVLQGKLPVAFFDEFDSRSYFWLQYLLAPMQDGRFQQGQLTHTLGKAIFIFAGGTSWTFGTFGPPEPPPGEDSNSVAARRFTEFRLAKGPDFKSRLDAFLDVVGPNQRVKAVANHTGKIDFEVAGHSFVNDDDDIWFPIRRALFIRNELGLAPDKELEIDPGLLNALLHIPRYTHGSRSLVKVLAPLKVALPAPLQPSHLPPPAQLAMHVDAGAFHELCSHATPPRPKPERLSPPLQALIAPEIHRTYNELGIRSGWLKRGEEKDLAEYAKSNPFQGQSNYEAAARMPLVLDCAGLRLEHGNPTSSEEQTIRQYMEYHLELLANAEHRYWMQWHFENGWSYHPKRDNKKLRHDCLKPFTELKEADRFKDREQVRHYPQFAKIAGQKIVFA